ncbi:hypothetical protein HK103_004295 [Boothiomyces macroporosus]|uniref:Uncharacterized protein n=1 Tax=Boothiomyces macroporosus TaxID=261099 RepID=A0AAD5Y8H0_9FUNG|nr:hypothetical protein HK103_004295 [Boothiomyces macroporosus]
MGGYPGFAGYGAGGLAGAGGIGGAGQFSGYTPYGAGAYNNGQFSGYSPYGAGAYNNGQFSGYGPGYYGAGTRWKRDAQSQNTNQEVNFASQCYTAGTTFQSSPTLAQCARNACLNSSITQLQYCYQLEQASSNTNGGQVPSGCGYATGFAGSYNNGQFSGYAPGFAGSYNSFGKRNTEDNDWNNIGKMCYLAAEESENNSQLSQCAMLMLSLLLGAVTANIFDFQSVPTVTTSAIAPAATPTFEKRFIGYNGYGDQLGALAAAQGLNQGASWNRGTEWNEAGAGDQGYGNYGGGVGAYGGFPGFGGFGK